MEYEYEYRNVSDHVQDLHDGRTVGPGDAVWLSDTDLHEDHNERLLAENIFITTGEDKRALDATKKAAARGRRDIKKLEEETAPDTAEEGEEG